MHMIKYVQQVFSPVSLFFLAGILSSISGDAVIKEISGDISSVMFDTLQKTYFVTDDIEVPKGKKVLIPAGTVLLFNLSTSFRINGSCTFDGTENAPVILSSIRDHQFNSNARSTALLNDWTGIIITDSSSEVTFNHVSIKYAIFPLVSKTNALQLNCMKFISTATDDITIETDTLATLSVPKNECCYYPLILHDDQIHNAIPPNADTITPEHVEIPVKTPVAPEKSWWKKPQYRWTIGGIGGATLIISTTCFIEYFVKKADKANAMEIYKDTSILDFDYRNEQRDIAIKAGEDSQEFFKYGIASSIISLVFLTGFTLTFYF